MTTSLLSTKGLTKDYGEGRGLAPLTLNIAAGEFVAVVGHNGAGKSTFLKMLATWIVPDSGLASIAGIGTADRLQLVQKIGFVPEAPNLYEHFSVAYNLQLFAKLFGLPKGRVEAVLSEFGLSDYRRTKVRNLSKGLKQRVSLGRSLLADPPVLILDEPTSGLDFDMTKTVYRDLQGFHKAGKTIIFSSHRTEEVRVLASRVIAIKGGSVVFDGSSGDYLESTTHQDLFLKS